MPSRVIGRYALEERARYDLLIVTERCAFCPEWTFTGTCAEGREAARAHRLQHHPDVLERRRRRKRHIGNWTQAEQIQHSDEERRKRAFLLGIDISEPAA